MTMKFILLGCEAISAFADVVIKYGLIVAGIHFILKFW